MEETIDHFFTLYNEEKRAQATDRASSSRLLLLQLLTDLAMPERQSRRTDTDTDTDTESSVSQDKL